MQSRGVFWIVDDELLTILYDEDSAERLSKSPANYNHRLFWNQVRPEGNCRQFDYYPRGCVEMTSRGKPVIFMGMSVDMRFIPQIIEAFGITEEPRIMCDSSENYMSYEERERRRRRNKRKIRRFDEGVIYR